MKEFNDWFASLPEGRQAVLRDDKWLLADSAYQAGQVEAQAEIDALKAQRDALLAAQQWLPIESAPKDGTRILLFFPNDVGVISGEWNFERFYEKPRPHFTHDQEQRWGVRHMRANQPTHWQPLPPPPAIAKTGEEL